MVEFCRIMIILCIVLQIILCCFNATQQDGPGEATAYMLVSIIIVGGITALLYGAGTFG